jgi:hypothetical protein
VTIKLKGSVSVNQGNGQLTVTFDENPQLPFSDLRMAFNPGARTLLANLNVCGEAKTTSDLTPWSAPFTPDATPSSSFEVSGCPSQIAFSPEFSAGTVNNQAAGFSPFIIKIARPDGNQTLSVVSVKTPPGLSGMLSQVSPCGEPQAMQGTCPASSQIGHVITSAGPGSSPIYLPQADKPQDPVYLTGPYKGAPLGLSIVVPAEAGPFNLGAVVERAAVSIDPHTAQITVTSDPLSQSLDGVPLQVRSISVIIDREGFIFNPTSCEPLTASGTITSAQGTIAAISSGYQAANCATLPFKPTFSVSTSAKASLRKGASLDAKISYPKGVEANIRKVVVDLPAKLPLRLTTIRKACLATVFDANPASCLAGSRIGTATAITPILNVPLTGPAFLVSHGNASSRKLVVVLQGQGITLELTGLLYIAPDGAAKIVFSSVPDAPISSFELKLPQGRSSALTIARLPAKAHGSLCGIKLVIPTTITAQNGAVIKQSARIAVTGCGKHKLSKHKRV